MGSRVGREELDNILQSEPNFYLLSTDQVFITLETLNQLGTTKIIP